MTRRVEIHTKRGEWIAAERSSLEISVYAGQCGCDGMALITPSDARRLAAALIAVANEIDQDFGVRT